MALKKTMPFFLSAVLLLAGTVLVLSSDGDRGRPVAGLIQEEKASSPLSPLNTAEERLSKNGFDRRTPASSPPSKKTLTRIREKPFSIAPHKPFV